MARLIIMDELANGKVCMESWTDKRGKASTIHNEQTGKGLVVGLRSRGAHILQCYRRLLQKKALPEGVVKRYFKLSK